MSYSDEQRFVASEDALARVLDGELVMLDLKSGTYFGMNEVGARVWEILTTGANIAAAIEILLTEFAVEKATLRADVQTLLAQLIEQGLIQPVEA